MKIVKCTFYNYRNLDGVTLYFDESCNFFVGENNIGKSNALYALNVMFSGEDFSDRDFFDCVKPIEIAFTVKTKDKRENYGSILKEYRLIKNKGEKKKIVDFSGEKVHALELKRILIGVNDKKSIISPFAKNKINAMLNNLQAVKRAKKQEGDYSFIDFFSGDENALKNQGYTYYFVKKVLLKILGGLKGKGEEQSRIILFDQPEKNLHPFAQKTLINDILRIVSGKDSDFNRLIDELFGVKRLEAQLIAVSHSDRILSERYESIIRFFRKDNEVTAKSGSNIKLKKDDKLALSKQLIMQFPYFSLAIFAKAVILVEGVSEYGAMGEFAKTLNIDLDYLGVLIVSANGEGNITSFSSLLEAFGIKVFAVKDRDVFCPKERNVTYTDFIDFEDEVVRAADLVSLEKIADYLGCLPLSVSALPLERKNERYKYLPYKRKKPFTDKDLRDNDVRRLAYVSALSAKKSVITGKIIGKVLSEEQIPSVYKRVLLSAKEYASKN